MKNCEICSKEIPDEFVNLLCMRCYVSLEGKTKFDLEMY